MAEFKRMGDYSLKNIGSGAETEVFRPKNRRKKGSPEKGLVIKSMAGLEDLNMHPERAQWKATEDGFDDNYKEILMEHHRKLKAEYGDIIAPIRFIKNSEHPKFNLIAQEYIELADPAAIIEYYPVDIDDEALKAKITRFVADLKRNILLSQADRPAIVPDLFQGNLVFNKDLDRIAYIDSGLGESVDVNDGDILHIARLAMLGGENTEALRQDPFFTEVLQRFPDLSLIDDEHDFYNALAEHEEEFLNKLYKDNLTKSKAPRP